VNIVPPYWLHPESLSLILQIETENREYTDAFSPPPRLPGQPHNRGQQQQQQQRRYHSPPPPRSQRTLDGQPYYPTPPFLPQNVAVALEAREPGKDPPALPYHWLEVGNLLLDAAGDDLFDPDQVRRLLKDLREVRMAKMRKMVDVLDRAATGGKGVAFTGVGAMEIGEMRGFVAGVAEGLRKIGASREQARREQLAEEGGPNRDHDGTQEDDDDDMEF
jgi:GINS complex subunit 2